MLSLRSFFGLIIGRVLPGLIGVYASYKITFYVIDNMKEVSEKVFGNKEVES
jgi:hypothetical protein